MPAPMRKVVKARPRPCSSINQAFKFYVWELDLECGHQVDRRIRWKPQEGPEWRKRRGFAAQWNSPGLDRLPDEPKRARCDECEREARRRS